MSRLPPDPSSAGVFHLRAATPADIATLEALIARSGVELSRGFYTPEQAVAITRRVFGVDSQLIADGTYFVIEAAGAIVACGGWSKRNTLFGADRTKGEADPLLDPATEPARIRAFFVAPELARRGLGRRLMEHCTREAAAHGFCALTLVATLPGEPLYAACGFVAEQRFALALDGIEVPVVRMRRPIGAGPAG